MNEPRKEITRGELHDAVWSKPIKLLAQEWGTTYAQVVKACDEMQVPRPSQGHWQLVARGMAIKRDPLPEPTGMVPNECQLVPPAVRQTKTKVPRKALDVRPPDKENAAPLPDTEPPKISGAEAGAITTGQEFHLQPAVDDAALDIIRQAVKIDFWRSRLSESVYAGGLSNWLGVPEGVKTSQPQLVNAIKDARKDYRAFSVNVDETKDQNYPDERRLNVTVMLKDGFEWKDAWEEAWSFAEQPNQYCLSDNALRLFIWAKGPKNTGRMMDQRKIGAQAKLRKTYSDMEKHLQEIRLKADPTIQWEK